VFDEAVPGVATVGTTAATAALDHPTTAAAANA
jgi:hypothetical protein